MEFSHEVVINRDREEVLTDTIKSRDHPREFSGSYSISHATTNNHQRSKICKSQY
jgi:hypothetical protein